jgi:hypothetical protein
VEKEFGQVQLELAKTEVARINLQNTVFQTVATVAPRSISVFTVFTVLRLEMRSKVPARL